MKCPPGDPPSLRNPTLPGPNVNCNNSTAQSRFDHNYARNTTCAPVNFALLNIRGLASKATLPDLLEFISDHSIILLTETKMDTYDILNVQIPEYTLFYKNRSVCCHKSGGIAAYINNDIVKYFTPVDNDSDTLWYYSEQKDYRP